ncbi:MAG: cupin domain-containing protein, partial [Psychroserpens sp.]|nr:cupin domain-containing protein [Psychroserpens sp.]
MYSVTELVKQLALEPHPEGGYFKETYRSNGVIPEDSLPSVFEGERNYATGIYYLLQSGDFSAFHKIHQDEMWHFYMGETLEITMISPEGEFSRIQLGQDLSNGEVVQFTVPKDYWFAAKVKKSNSYAFVGCTVAPGFDFRDFELADRDALIAQFPK